MTDPQRQITRYINTDLDVAAQERLDWLVNFFARRRTHCLAHHQHPDGTWFAVFEYSNQYLEPQPAIIGLLEQIEAMGAKVRAKWDRCERREFNVGYETGDEPWAFNQAIDATTTSRVAAVGAGVRITLYPLRPSPSAGGSNASHA